MSTHPNNQEPRKLARITEEQELLLRLYDKVKKMRFGQLTIFLQGGNIVRYEAVKSESLIDKKTNREVLKEIAAETDDLEGMEGVIAI